MNMVLIIIVSVSIIIGLAMAADETDGGKWRSAAIQNVANFLNDNLSNKQGSLDFIVLA